MKRAAVRFRHSTIRISALLICALLSLGWPVQRSAAQPSPRAPLACTVTRAATEGPFYTAGSPQRTNLVEAGMVGARVLVTGYVYDTNCLPVANAWVDFWQADYNGAYDNIGYRLRGHQYTDANGRYRLETIVAGEYTGRTIHIHVKVQAPGGPVLTTQLFFPDVAHNSTDNIYHPSLVVALTNNQGVKTGTFNFVVNSVSQAPRPSSNASHTFMETGFSVSGRFWDVWQGMRSFESSLYVNGYPITGERDEVSPTDGKVYKTQWFERARYEAHPQNQAPNDVLLGLLGLPSVQGREKEEAFRPIANPGDRLQWLTQTGHTIGDNSDGGRAIAAFWSQQGDVRQFGLPLSQPFMETNKADGETYLVQYFERQRLEYHPEFKGTRYEVMLGRLGAEQVTP